MIEPTDPTGGEQPEQPSWRKARLPVLAPSATAETALAEIISSGVEHLRGNAACVAARTHEEGVHQMRVAARRLRSSLALYEPYIPSEQRTYLEGEIRWLLRALGPARDWDVFVAEILQPVERAFSDEDRLVLLRGAVEQQRDQAYAAAQLAVAAQRYVGLLMLLSSWAEGRGWRSGGDDGNASARLRTRALDVSRELLQQIHSQALAVGENFEDLDAEARHKVRIELKKLRYATEFFSSLYPRRKVEPYVAALKAMQDDLGANNDVHVARKLLKRVLKSVRGKERAKLAFAAGLVVGWHAHDGGREADLLRDWTTFVNRTPYWQTAVTREAAALQAQDTSLASASGAGAASEDEPADAVPAPGLPPFVRH